MQVTFQPVHDRIAIQLDPKSSTTKGGLYLPDNANKPIMGGLVVGVGPEVKSVSIMDKILIDSYHTGIELEINDKKVLVIKEKDVLGIVKVKEETAGKAINEPIKLVPKH